MHFIHVFEFQKALVSSLNLFAFLLILAWLSLAQSTGGIQGTVTDASGAVLSAAEIEVTNTATGQRQTVTTNDAGIYVLPSLPTGTYNVQVKAPGMQTTVASNITVAVSTATRQDFALQVASSTQTVEIQGGSPVVETTSVSMGAVVDQRTVQEIPLNGRHFVDLALLVPGTVTPPQNGFLTSPLRGQGTSSFNSAGAREDTVIS